MDGLPDGWNRVSRWLQFVSNWIGLGARGIAYFIGKQQPLHRSTTSF